MADLGFVVVGVDLQAETNFLEDRVGLVLTRFARLDRSLVLVLSEVHQFAHGRLCGRRNLNEIKIGLHGKTKSILNTDNANLFTGWADEPHLWDADSIINAWIADV